MTVEPTQRLSDAEREVVVGRLREALGEGRLDLDDFYARLDAAYAAKTHGEVVPLSSDLPTPTALPVPATPQRRAGRHLRSYLSTFSVLWGIWTIALISGGGTQGWWPLWVTGLWGLRLLL